MTTQSLRKPLRHLTSINDLTNEEVEDIFHVSRSYLEQFSTPEVPHRIGRSTGLASDFILATLFYEPSTRTRLSFESAMLRLGGKVITSSDPATSSAAKGESIADSVRVIGNYSDVIVIRHPRDGAARLAADYSPVPVINGGDGSHEHPTQTLCDMFTLITKHKKLKDLNVVISGDLKGSRTTHSFVYALARFGANIILMPAKGMELPKGVDTRLREEFGCFPVPKDKVDVDDHSIDALYITPDQPHQLSLIPSPDISIDIDGDSHISIKIRRMKKKVDAMYVTRFQRERWTDKDQEYPIVDSKMLKHKKYSGASIMHPLPRVGELDASLDTDDRAVYFQQAAFGVPIRMALLSLVLNLHPTKSLTKYPDGLVPSSHPIYDQPKSMGIGCRNTNCIVHDEHERPYSRNKFLVISRSAECLPKLRCYYCDTEIENYVVVDIRTKTISDLVPTLGTVEALGFQIAFPDEVAARQAGFRRSSPLNRGTKNRQAPRHVVQRDRSERVKRHEG
jgi:aspartate carbamoyltransferase catalytic subunit